MNTRSQLRLITIAWLFGAAWLYTVTGATMNQFARAMGTPDWGFGLLAALPFIGALFRLPSSYMLERWGHRRELFLICLTVSRSMWVVAAAIPWLMPGLEPLWWPTMAAMLGLAWIGDALGGTAWMNWMADVVPNRVRGRYFAFRHRASVVIALLVMVSVGYVLDLAEIASTEAPGAMLTITSILIMLAGLLGVMDIQCFTRMRDEASPPVSREVNWFRKLREPLADREFRKFLAFNFTLAMATGYIGQYVWLFVLKQLEIRNTTANVLLLGVPMLITLVSVGFWGRLVDRIGRKPVLVLSGVLFVAGPLGWFFATKESWLLGYLMTSISPFAFPGLNIATFNMLLDRSSDGSGKKSKRGKPAKAAEPIKGGSAYVAAHSIAFAIGGILSGAIAGIVAGRISNFTWQPVGTGLVLTYHHVLFAVSSGLRVVAVAWAFSMNERGAATTRDSIRIAGAELWFTVRSTVTLPARVVDRMARSKVTRQVISIASRKAA